MTVEASGASQLDAEQLQIGDLTVGLSGASTATVSVTDTISAQLSGVSNLAYQGTPRFTRKDVSGGSTIEQA
jgi:putative autotransporter adhesin-like protein